MISGGCYHRAIADGMDAEMLRSVRIVVEQYESGFVAYPLGITGAVVGEGDTAEAAVSDVRSALRFHIETFGPDVFDEPPVLDAFVVEDAVTIT